jgi:hypothetical protein
MKKIKEYLDYKKSPNFNPVKKFRYAEGLGDIITCFLHSKYFGLMTYIITNELEPCLSCDNRRVALNILFPTPIWKFFFKNENERLDSIIEEYKKIGIELEEADDFLEENNVLDDQESCNNFDCKNSCKCKNEDEYSGYFLSSDSKTIIENGNMILNVRIFTKDYEYRNY